MLPNENNGRGTPPFLPPYFLGLPRIPNGCYLLFCTHWGIHLRTFFPSEIFLAVGRQQWCISEKIESCHAHVSPAVESVGEYIRMHSTMFDATVAAFCAQDNMGVWPHHSFPSACSHRQPHSPHIVIAASILADCSVCKKNLPTRSLVAAR